MTEVVSLSDVVVRTTGNVNPLTFPDAEFLYVDVAAVDNVTKSIEGPKRIRGSAAPSRARKIIRENDVLVSTIRPNLNAVAMVPLHLDGQVASTGFCVLRARDTVLPQYLYYFVRSQPFVDRVCRLVAGALYPAVTDGQVLSQPLPLPNLARQREVVEILSRAESIVKLRRQANEKCGLLVSSIYNNLLGDPSEANLEVSERALGTVSEVVSGVTKGRKFGNKETLLAPYLRVANVQDGHIDLSEIKTVEVPPTDVTRLELQHGDVLMTEGGDFDKLGRGALWEHDIPGCIHQNHVFRVRLDRNTMLPEVFVTYLRSAKTREYFLRCAKRTTNLASINMSQLRALPVVVPPMDSQIKFLEMFEGVRSIQVQQAVASEKAESAFRSLLSDFYAT